MILFNDIEAEVDAIRDKIYLTTKKMTSQERVDYINSQAGEIMQKHGIEGITEGLTKLAEYTKGMVEV